MTREMVCRAKSSDTISCMAHQRARFEKGKEYLATTEYGYFYKVQAKPDRAVYMNEGTFKYHFAVKG